MLYFPEMRPVRGSSQPGGSEGVSANFASRSDQSALLPQAQARQADDRAWRRMTPDRGSREKFGAGKTNRHPHSAGAPDTESSRTIRGSLARSKPVSPPSDLRPVYAPSRPAADRRRKWQICRVAAFLRWRGFFFGYRRTPKTPLRTRGRATAVFYSEDVALSAVLPPSSTSAGRRGKPVFPYGKAAVEDHGRRPVADRFSVFPAACIQPRAQLPISPPPPERSRTGLAIFFPPSYAPPAPGPARHR